jgi:hypothetical protein
VSGAGESSNAEAATCVCCGYYSLQLGQDHRILDIFFERGRVQSTRTNFFHSLLSVRQLHKGPKKMENYTQALKI